MIITQKYHSAGEIDPEFIPGIEELLKTEVPHFEWELQSEKDAPPNVHFNYFLFFGNRHNAPIGYAKFALTPLSDPPPNHTIWHKIYNKIKKPAPILKHANCAVFFVHPREREEVITKSGPILKEIFAREDVSELSFISTQNETQSINNVYPFSENIELPPRYLLHKSSESYQEHLATLTSENKNKISSEWKRVASQLKLSIGEYSGFKEAFEYKTNATEQYKQLKKMPELKRLIKDAKHIMTLEDKDEVKAIVFLVPGTQGHFFFDGLNLTPNLNDNILIQMANMLFFEIKEAKILHPIRNISPMSNWQNWGYEICPQFQLLNLKPNAHN